MNKTVFLDRDGVINKYPGDRKYVTSVKGFTFIPGVKEAIAKMYKAGCRIFVISNQAGVNKGVFKKKTLNDITRKMLGEINDAGGMIEEAYYCVHRPEEDCGCRKPRPGLIEKARRKYSLKKKNSFFIGDTIRDIQAARAAGCTSILVLSGKEKMTNHKSWEARPDFVFKDLKEAADFILSIP